MSCVYFVRHGESEWNVLDKVCGKTDIPLTVKGHEQAIETGKNILESGIKADYILSSPLLRAYETAKHISEMTGIPVTIDNRLVEQCFGKYEGISPRNHVDFEVAKCLGKACCLLRLAEKYGICSYCCDFVSYS